MKRIALTGGIGTGKSYVLDCFRALGVPCLDADMLAHGVTAPGTEATHAIVARFGPEVVDGEGAIDRQKLAAIVFADPAARRDLESIVHSAVYRAIAAGLRAFELVGGAAAAVVDIPLLYETGRASDFDQVISTFCPPAMQKARLLARGMTEAEVEARLAAQMSAEEKAARAHFVIRTDGTMEETDAQVDKIWAAVRC